MAEPLLAATSLCRFFGGLAAVNRVDLTLAPGEIHAVIGPNGAGKTTLINLLAGEIPPTFGSISLAGEDVTGLPAHRMAHKGVARSYQRSNVYGDFSALENCRLAVQARRMRGFGFVRPASSYPELVAEASRALALAGLDRTGRRAETLSHGERRQLEIAVALAMAPKLLLLDEPLAGMGAEEGTRITELISRLAASHAVLLVEHDMDAVFSIAHRVTVMVDGKVLATGTPRTIREDRAVQEAYLGKPEAAA